ncbi:MAG: hypothetical protein ACHREM_02220 [Polyangiales bacterium]
MSKKPEPILSVNADGDVTECTLSSFLNANADGISLADARQISAFKVGQRMRRGGGAGSTWAVRRIA